ncbi:MAG: AMP-binding protein [Hyphomicrobiales bacterium]|nr:AMP-binding protein [Hyphomicrobiales bacterium]
MNDVFAAAAPQSITEVKGHRLPADTMGGLFWHRVESEPDSVGFRFEKQVFTNREFGALVGRIRATLQRDGIERGSRIAAFMYNSPFLLALFMACASDGVVFCPINVALRRSDLAYTLGDVKPALVFFDAELADIYLPAAGEVGVERSVIVGDAANVAGAEIPHLEGWLASSERIGAAPGIAPSDPLCIIYSGGTTGLPKGIVMPQFGPVAAALRFDLIAEFGPHEVYFSVLQISHSFTPLIALPFCLMYGHTFCFWKRWSASHYVDMVVHLGATISDAFIGMIATLLRTQPRPEDAALRKVRVIAGLGGLDAVAMKLRDDFVQRFGSATYDLYGFTESNGLVAFERDADPRKPGACGKVCDWFDVLVADKHDLPVAIGTTGEVLVRPRVPYTVGLGYHNKFDVTMHTWRNLWIHTGDLAYFDANGYLFYVGRRNHFLRRRGELISAAEIERVVLNFPDVIEVAVVAAPSEFGEDEVRACVVSSNSDFDPRKLVDYLREQVAPFKVPRYVDVLDTLPRSGAKREIEKFKLQARDLALAWDSTRDSATEASDNKTGRIS